MFSISKLSEYLSKQPEDKELAVVSFFITNPKSLKKLHEQWALRDRGHGKILKKNITKVKTINEDNFGGSIVLVDPLNLNSGFIAEIKIPLAFGLLVDHKNKSLYVTSGKKIFEIKRRQCIKTISNNLFNDLHCITFSLGGNILVASTGTDSILETNNSKKGKIYWDWFATENGFDTTQSGTKRIIKRNFDYRLITTTTPEHTTHINSILNDKPNRILATLFHQGQLVEINRQTKKHNVLLSGLKSPHNIRKTKNGFILSDSRSNRVLLLNNRFKIKKVLKSSFNWVQDAIEISEKEKYLIADSNNYRLLLIDYCGNQKSCFKWPKDSRKIAGIELINVLEAKNIFCL